MRGWFAPVGLTNPDGLGCLFVNPRCGSMRQFNISAMNRCADHCQHKPVNGLLSLLLLLLLERGNMNRLVVEGCPGGTGKCTVGDKGRWT